VASCNDELSVAVCQAVSPPPPPGVPHFIAYVITHSCPMVDLSLHYQNCWMDLGVQKANPIFGILGTFAKRTALCFPTSTLTSKLFIMFFLQGGRFKSKCKLSDIIRPTDMSSLSISLPPFSISFTPNQDPHKASHSVISLELDLKG